MTETEMELDKVRHDLFVTKTDLDYVKSLLQEAGNELCYKCGQYREEHLGACNGCRWRYVKSGEMPT